jgi:hypothetical protein
MTAYDATTSKNGVWLAGNNENDAGKINTMGAAFAQHGDIVVAADYPGLGPLHDVDPHTIGEMDGDPGSTQQRKSTV